MAWVQSRGRVRRRLVQQGEPGGIDVKSTVQVRGLGLLVDVRIETSCIPLKSVLRSKLINFPCIVNTQ